MKKTWMFRILLLMGYGIPFAFLAVNGDGTSGTMVFYGLMVVGLTLLCRGAIKTNNIGILYLGNLLSFASSYGAAKLSGLEPMGHYFKPFTSGSLIVAISILAVLLQTIAVAVARGRRTKAARPRKGQE